MGWLKQLCLSWIILSAVAACVSCQDLRSTLREGNRTCPGDEVIFTCTIRGPSNLQVIGVAWSSAEYITGQGGSLQLSTANMIGAIETSTDMYGNITATATVTNNTNVNGEPILETTLRITAVVASTVICRDLNRGPASIEFTISAVPGVPLDITAREISQSVESTCIILVQWGPPTNNDDSDIAQYIVYIPSRNINMTVSSTPPTFTTLSVPNCGDDVRVKVAAVNRIGCVGLNSSEVQPTLLDIPAVPTDNGSTTAEGGSTSTSSQLSAGAIVGIVIGVILPILCFLGLVFGCTCIFYVHIAGKCTRKSTEMEEVLLREVSTIRQKDFWKNLVELYTALKKDWSEDDKLSSVESLSQMMENPTLSKRYIKEALKIALKTIKLDHDGGVKKVLVYLKINVPKVLSSFDDELKDKGTDKTMDGLIRAAEQNVHAEVFDELMKIMDSTEPEVVERLLRTMFEELQKHLQSKVSSIEVKWVTNLPGGEVHMELPP